jgi:hypothetical protein
MSKDKKESGRVSEPRVAYRTRKRTPTRKEREAAWAEIERIRKKYGKPEKGWDSVKVLRQMRYGE